MEKILTLLRLLYGETAGEETGTTVEVMLRKWKGRLPDAGNDTKSGFVDHRDAVLITYADQVREAGKSPLKTLTDFCEKHLQGSINTVHLLPFYPWSSDDGFAVKDFYAVDAAFGSWDDVGRLGKTFDLMFDAVFNHMSAQSEWFQRFQRDDPEFRDFFVTVEGEPDLSAVVRPRVLPLLTEFECPSGKRRVWTTFSVDQVDLNFKNPRVLLAVLAVLLFYVSRGARFIRLDAIAFLWKEPGTCCVHLRQTHEVIQLFRAVLDQVAPRVCLITETNVPHADNISYFGDGTNEAQLVYNFALPPLVLHALSTGKATVLSHWAGSLRTPSPRTAFFNFLASHDGVGLNPAWGILTAAEIDGLVQRARRHGGLVSYKNNPDGSQSPYELNISWFDALNDPGGNETVAVQVDRFVVSQAIMLSLAGVPGIYFHSLFGSRNDRAAVESMGIARRINREKLDAARLNHELGTKGSLRATVFERFSQMLRVRRAHRAFDPQGSQEVVEVDDRVFMLVRTSPDGAEQVVCLHNLANRPVSLQLPQWLKDQMQRCRNLLRPGSACSVGDPTELAAYETMWLYCPA